MVIFHSYVSLPKGTPGKTYIPFLVFHGRQPQRDGQRQEEDYVLRPEWLQDQRLHRVDSWIMLDPSDDQKEILVIDDLIVMIGVFFSGRKWN